METIKRMGYDATHTYVDYPNGALFDDATIVQIALKENRIVISKDKDFLNHFVRYGAPPSVLLITLGNISNLSLKQYFEDHFSEITDLFGRKKAGLVIAGIHQITSY